MLEPVAEVTEVARAADSGVRPLTDAEFGRFQRLIFDKAGIHLAPVKKALVAGRLGRRIRELGLSSYGAYYDYALRVGAAEIQLLLDQICTNETHFFRDQRQFDFLAKEVCPEWKRQAAAGERQKRLRIWSSACSTGEEPYSIAMQLLDAFESDPGWSIEIVATDLSTKVLSRAKEGLWPLAKAEEIPRRLLHRYMLRGVRTQTGWIKGTPELRSVIRFEHMNLNDETYPVKGPFDLIFCRNVLIYFNRISKKRVIERLLRELAPTGLLFLGQAETLTGLTERMRTCGPTVYRFGTGTRG